MLQPPSISILKSRARLRLYLHLVVEHLGLSRLSLGNQRLVQYIKNILADLLEFVLNLLTVFTDRRDMLVSTLGLLLLFDGGDDAPGGTSSTHDVLVGNGQEISLIDSQLSTKLDLL